jgi:hypothetical protein
MFKKLLITIALYPVTLLTSYFMAIAILNKWSILTYDLASYPTLQLKLKFLYYFALWLPTIGYLTIILSIAGTILIYVGVSLVPSKIRAILER